MNDETDTWPFPHRRRVALCHARREDCSVCLNGMLRRRVMVLPCKHTFHLSCYSKLVSFGHRRCPLCRSELDTDAPKDGVASPPPVRRVRRALIHNSDATDAAWRLVSLAATEEHDVSRHSMWRGLDGLGLDGLGLDGLGLDGLGLDGLGLDGLEEDEEAELTTRVDSAPVSTARVGWGAAFALGGRGVAEHWFPMDVARARRTRRVYADDPLARARRVRVLEPDFARVRTDPETARDTSPVLTLSPASPSSPV